MHDSLTVKTIHEFTTWWKTIWKKKMWYFLPATTAVLSLYYLIFKIPIRKPEEILGNSAWLSLCSMLIQIITILIPHVLIITIMTVVETPVRIWNLIKHGEYFTLTLKILAVVVGTGSFLIIIGLQQHEANGTSPFTHEENTYHLIHNIAIILLSVTVLCKKL